MLQSISVRFDEIEDRLLIKLSIDDAAGARDLWLHLTRRVCMAWRRDLQTMLEMSAQAPARLDAAGRASVSAAHHEAMAQQAAVRHVPPAATPPDARPALITSVHCGRRREDGRWIFRFELRGQASLSIVVTPTTLHGLVEALSRRTQVAGWSLPTLAPETPSAPTDSSAFH